MFADSQKWSVFTLFFFLLSLKKYTADLCLVVISTLFIKFCSTDLEPGSRICLLAKLSYSSHLLNIIVLSIIQSDETKHKP